MKNVSRNKITKTYEKIQNQYFLKCKVITKIYLKITLNSWEKTKVSKINGQNSKKGTSADRLLFLKNKF